MGGEALGHEGDHGPVPLQDSPQVL